MATKTHVPPTGDSPSDRFAWLIMRCSLYPDFNGSAMGYNLTEVRPAFHLTGGKM